MEKNNSGATGVKEIARLANVSIGTVDRVLNNRVGVSEKTKAKILKIIEELNYQPNIFARRLASKKKLRFATLIPQVSAETKYWEAPLNGILQAAAEIKDFGIEVAPFFFDQNDKATFNESAVKIRAGEFDGILMAPMFEEESIAFIEDCKEKKIPLVFINSDIPGHSNLCYIGPNLYQSGYLAAHIVNYLSPANKKTLVVNISKEIDLHHHLLRKEEGFRNYFEQNGNTNKLTKIDIQETGYAHIQQKLNEQLAKDKYDVVFVTNSRVSTVARYFEENKIKDIKLIGYDFLEDNINYLKNKTIDFLICQKPQEQGYRGLMSLYYHLVLHSNIEKEQFMPIDIITKENYLYYSN
ncbi:MAG: LacI family DNA-binding transcriptional regulator [Pedobacter sp.]|uniref:LacI family DNA-binding transcriptional regulator n=1 Tax=Pedobacter sp. TaxID=1411316 RepID=UPI0028094961|nr:LacI family DNA-binding transcriptional regulator [Pedobacter sp.]MDQ8003556.1 LacI family DNA-binding transcriptional regulator [Pedobacter sp.]